MALQDFDFPFIPVPTRNLIALCDTSRYISSTRFALFNLNVHSLTTITPRSLTNLTVFEIFRLSASIREVFLRHLLETFKPVRQPFAFTPLACSALCELLCGINGCDLKRVLLTVAAICSLRLFDLVHLQPKPPSRP